MTTRDDLERLLYFARQSHKVGAEMQILGSMKLDLDTWNETLLRLEADLKAAVPAAVSMVKAYNDLARRQETDGADKRARIAKLNYDAAIVAGLPSPEAFAIAVEAVRQECTKQ